MKSAQIVSFKPHKVLHCPTRSGASNYTILEPGNTYALIDKTADSFIAYDPEGELSFLCAKDDATNAKTMALLFPGGIGDVICMKACIELLDRNEKIFPNLETIYYFGAKADKTILCDGAIKRLNLIISNYPPIVSCIDWVDSIFAFGPLQRQSVHNEISDTLASIIGMPPPKRAATLIPNDSLVEFIRNSLPGNKSKKNIGLQIYSSAQYRTIPPPFAILIAKMFIEAGFNVYIFGASGQRVRFMENGVVAPAPEGLYDMSGLFSGYDEYIAMLSLMDGVICPDTSMLHFAGCLNIPTAVLFGPTSGEWRTQYYPSVISFGNFDKCPLGKGPCYSNAEPMDCGAKFCPCITSINIYDIFDGLMEIMK